MAMKFLVFYLMFISFLFGGSFARDDGRDVVVDNLHNLVWQDDVFSATQKLSFKNGVAYCHTLALSDMREWRLPTPIELGSLVDTTRTPTIESAFKHSADGGYWTDGKSASGNELEWVDFTFGTYHKGDGYGKAMFVRCVRNK